MCTHSFSLSFMYAHSHTHMHTCVHHIHTLTHTHTRSLACTPCSDDEDASVASRRAALYSTNTVAQITSKKDTEPDRMEIDNTFGKLCHTTLYYAYALSAVDCCICGSWRPLTRCTLLWRPLPRLCPAHCIFSGEPVSAFASPISSPSLNNILK